MLSLRTADGLDVSSFAAQYGAEAAAVLTPVLLKHEAAGLVALRRGGGGGQQEADSGSSGGQQAASSGGSGGGEIVWARLTDPEGFLVSNDIISDLFAAY